MLAEFSQLITGQRLIEIHNDSSISSLTFVDIYPDVAAYEDRHTASFSNMLMAKGLLHQTSNVHVVSWYNKEFVHAVVPSATMSLRWIDVHELQMPAVCFAAKAPQPSYSQSYVVGNVMAVQSPSLYTSDNKKKAVTQDLLPRTTTDHLQKEKMERVDSWLKHECHKSPKKGAFRMCVDNVTSCEGALRPGNNRAEVRTSEMEGKPYKAHCSTLDASGSTSVPLQSSLVSSSVVTNPHQQKPSRSQWETYDTPERDVNRRDQSRPDCTELSHTNCASEDLVSKQQYCDNFGQKHKKHSVSTSVPASRQCRSDDCRGTRVPVRELQERPLYTREENTGIRSKVSSCSLGEKKADFSAIRDTVTPKHADDNICGVHFPKVGASDVHPRTDIQSSPLVAETETDSIQAKSDLSVGKLCEEKSVASTKSLTPLTALKEAVEEDAFFSVDNPSSTFANKVQTPTIPQFSFVPVGEDIPLGHDVSEDDVCSESSSSLSATAKTRLESDAYLTANETCSTVSATSPKKLTVVSSESSSSLAKTRLESDAYLTANETPSTVSATSAKKCTAVSSAVSCGEVSLEACHGDPCSVSEDETVLNDHTVNAADVTNTSHCLPSVKFEIPESRCVPVCLSYVESPHRFWVNIISEQITQLDWVTDVLNTMDLKPVDPSSGGIELNHCYSAQSDNYKLLYRAEVVEICYGDAHCSLSLSDDCKACLCDQLMRLPTDPVKAVKVCLCLQFMVCHHTVSSNNADCFLYIM